MFKKFTNAQQHYAVHEQETLAILEALQKWEDKLVGHRFHVIMDHKALEFFQAQAQLANRQRHWLEYMSRFDFDITYVKGEYNKVADCLSQYFESDTSADEHDFHNYVQADRRIDPNGEDLPIQRLQEIKERRVEISSMHAMTMCQNRKLQEAQELREEEAVEMQQATAETQDMPQPPAEEEDPTKGDILGHSPTGQPPMLDNENPEEDQQLLQTIKDNYEKDLLTRTMLANPENHKKYFRVSKGLIWTKNFHGTEVICIPRENSLITQLLTKAHEVVGHYGDQRTCEYTRRLYWWQMQSR
jgi:hypothetical protein